MKSESVEKWVWPLIFGGMGIGMLGLWTLESEAPVAYVLSVLGGIMIAAGVLLVWVRSRIGKTPDAPPKAPR